MTTAAARPSSAGKRNGLVRDALSAIPAGELVLGAVAPGNAASVRLLLSAGTWIGRSRVASCQPLILLSGSGDVGAPPSPPYSCGICEAQFPVSPIELVAGAVLCRWRVIFARRN